jgi:hypothetical protein
MLPNSQPNSALICSARYLEFVPENTIKGLFVLIIIDDSVIMCYILDKSTQ